MSLPSLPPPPSSLLPTLSISDQHYAPPSHPGPGRPGVIPAHKTPPATSSRHSLAVLSQDERAITSRKTAIAMYGYSWLRPAGCAKTMLGRREEELEREELERQNREADADMAGQTEIEEGERQGELERQRGIERQGGLVQGEQGDRDLDEEVPDAETEGMDDEEEEDEIMEGDLDDEVPDGEEYRYDSRREPDTDTDVEGETGITDDVEASHLHSSGRRANLGPPPPIRLPVARGGVVGVRVSAPGSEWDGDDAEAIANAMLDEDEMGDTVERDLDDDIPIAADERDLDDDVPEPEDDEGGWEHTDTELEESEVMTDESAMDISGVIQTRSQTRRRSGNAAAGAGRVQFQTPGTAQSGSTSGGGMSWLAASGPRRNLFGRGPANGVLGGGRNITPPVLTPDVVQSVRRSGRRPGTRRGTENEDQLRQSLD